MNAFSPREAATGMWLCVVLVLLLSNASLRRSLSDLVRLVASPLVLIPLVVFAGYVVLMVLGLQVIGFWSVELAKDTLMWFLMEGLVAVGSVMSAVAQQGVVSVKQLTVDSLRGIVLLEFLVSEYTLSLWAELLLVPLATFVCMLDAFAAGRKEHSSVSAFVSKLQVVIGLSILGYALSRAVLDYRRLTEVMTLKRFLLPIVLSVSLAPMLLLFVIYVRYDWLFAQLRMGPAKSKSLMRYAKWRMFTYLGSSMSRLASFTKAFAPRLMRLKTRNDVDQLVLEAKQMLETVRSS